MKPVVFQINKQTINKNNTDISNKDHNYDNKVKNNIINNNSNKPIKLVENIYYFKK